MQFVDRSIGDSNMNGPSTWTIAIGKKDNIHNIEDTDFQCWAVDMPARR